MFTSKKIDKCTIKFENDRMVYYPGETLKGKFILEMNRSMKMKNIVAVCKGKSKTEWEKGHFDSEKEKTIMYEYEKKHKYFEIKKKIFGGGDDDDKEEHDAGLHEYDFEFEIPKDLPNSWEQKHVGYIRYSVKIIVKKPWKKDLKLKKMFVINTLIDANDPKYNVAPGDEDQKTLGCLCCESGPITLSANLNRSAFCSGDNILVTAHLVNNTERDMDELEAELMQEVSAKAHNDTHGMDHKKTVIKVAELESKKIKGGDSLDWKAKPMAVPPLPPTMDGKLIDIKYWVRIHLDVPMGIDMDFKLPVTIASVPFKTTYQDSPGERQSKYKPKAPESIGHSDMSFLQHPDMWPFQFSQLLKEKPIKMNKKDDKEFADDTYIPIYTFALPVEGFDQPQSEIPSNAGSSTSVKSNMPPIE